MRMDIARSRARRDMARASRNGAASKLHLGCGKRRVAGWFNVDVAESEQNIDLAAGRLPWRDGQFSAVVSQHVIEHLELESELLPLLAELHRVMAPQGEIWLSCPDLATICNSYTLDRGQGLVDDRKTRPHTDIKMDGVPPQHMINRLFHQSGEHKNLFDFELLEWALTKAGFQQCVRVVEADLLKRFPEFPPRNDDYVSLYVRAVR
jgi:predicted SAM-dependent methyltransferase